MGALIAWIVTAVIVAEWFWWIVGVVAVAWVGRRLWKAYDARHWTRVVLEAEHAAIAARADEQDAWFLAGDPRGLYGEYPPVDIWPTPKRGPAPKKPAERRRSVTPADELRAQRARLERERAKARAEVGIPIAEVAPIP